MRPYVQLREEPDYEALQEVLEAAALESPEAGRVFYLAVPPRAYASIAEWIHTKVRAVD